MRRVAQCLEIPLAFGYDKVCINKFAPELVTSKFDDCSRYVRGVFNNCSRKGFQSAVGEVGLGDIVENREPTNANGGF